MNNRRLRIVELLFITLILVILGKLFYWQVLSSDSLARLAQSQRESVTEIPASRGKILAFDNYPLVSNQAAYLAYAYTPDLKESTQSIAAKLGGLISPDPTNTAIVQQTTASLSARLISQNSSWIPLAHELSETTKQAIENQKINGIGFEQSEIRYYPEASMAANLLGFVGSDGSGNSQGYFGLEGRYNFELSGRPGLIRQEKDALGKPIVTGDYADIKGRDGRTLKTYIDRGLQFLVERELVLGIQKYEAKSGEVIIIDPKTGGIKAMAIYPNFDPADHRSYTNDVYKNPSISDTYEPGSTFKTIVMAAAINEHAVTPDTVCDDPCSGPVQIGKYAIRTWDNKYHPGETMTQVLELSDNTGMVYVANKLGKDKLLSYIDKFGMFKPTNIDLEGEMTAKPRDKWGDIDVATASFGQGIAVNTMQMLMGVASLANKGNLMEPHVVASVIDGDKEVPIEPKIVAQVVTPETAQTMTQMMLQSAQHGDAKWAVPKDLEIAGKTGTAQIPIAGHYDPNKTMASFVGFAPASNPQFVMIVKLSEPQSSQWASETAAPLWFKVAKQIFQYYSIPTKSLN